MNLIYKILIGLSAIIVVWCTVELFIIYMKQPKDQVIDRSQQVIDSLKAVNLQLQAQDSILMDSIVSLKKQINEKKESIKQHKAAAPVRGYFDSVDVSGLDSLWTGLKANKPADNRQ